MTPYGKAIFFALLSTAGFAIQDTVVKLLTQVGSIWQLMLLRSLVVIALLCLWARFKDGWSDITPTTFSWPLVRAFLCVSLTHFFMAVTRSYHFRMRLHVFLWPQFLFVCSPTYF